MFFSSLSLSLPPLFSLSIKHTHTLLCNIRHSRSMLSERVHSPPAQRCSFPGARLHPSPFHSTAAIILWSIIHAVIIDSAVTANTSAGMLQCSVDAGGGRDKRSYRSCSLTSVITRRRLQVLCSVSRCRVEVNARQIFVFPPTDFISSGGPCCFQNSGDETLWSL